MDAETKRLVAELLDSAVATVAGQKFNESIDGLTLVEKVNAIERATNSLDELRRGGCPDYDDPLVAVFYLAQYQLQHINLAYSMIAASQLVREQGAAISRNGRLHVVDFGCGALAMRFGVLFATADAIEAGHLVEIVRIDSLDPAIPLVELGTQIWEEFITLVNTANTNNLHWVRQALKTINPPNIAVRQGVRLNEIQALQDADAWLSAFHAFYESPDVQNSDLREDLRILQDAISPVAGYLTTHNSKERIALGVSPFGDEYYCLTDEPEFQFGDDFDSESCSEILHIFRPPNWRVFWGWDRRTVFLTYGRR